MLGEGGVKSKLALLLGLLVFLSPITHHLSLVWAEDLTVVARVDKTEVRTDQTLRFSVTIAGPLRKAPKVKLTALDGFQILSSGTSQEFQLHKGRRRQAMTLTYRLAPPPPEPTHWDRLRWRWKARFMKRSRLRSRWSIGVWVRSRPRSLNCFEILNWKKGLSSNHVIHPRAALSRVQPRISP